MQRQKYEILRKPLPKSTLINGKFRYPVLNVNFDSMMDFHEKYSTLYFQILITV